MVWKPTRRWFRFSVRTLLVAVTLISAGCGWVTYQLNWITQRHEALRSDGIQGNPNMKHTVNDKPYAPNGLWLFGEKGQSTLIIAKRLIPDARIEELRHLFPEAELWLRDDGPRGTIPPLHR